MMMMLVVVVVLTIIIIIIEQTRIFFERSLDVDGNKKQIVYFIHNFIHIIF